MHYCCVLMCRNNNKVSKMHRFPQDEELCKIWLEKISNPKLTQKELRVLRDAYRVCDRHFAEDCRVQGRHGADILATSIPTLHIPPAVTNEPILGPSSEASTSTLEEEDSFREMEQPNEQPLEVPMEIDESRGNENRSPVQPARADISHTPRTRKDLRRRVSLLKSVNVTSVQQLTPKARKLHRIARAFRSTAKQLDFECANAKMRLKEAQKLIDTPDFMQAKMNKMTYNFILSQLKNQRLSPRARRFTLDDKIMALCLWKQSPKGYKLLRRIFAVPSKKTLLNLLKKIPFAPGINQPMVDLLKRNVETLNPLDKCCVILFDEMAIEPTLLYNKQEDFIEGFQDNGNDERRPLFVDKVMVFMARGVHKKWKQPFAYYFNEGGMKKDMLAKTIKDVVRAAKSTGLDVVATVCDQGTANVAAIQSLYKETEAIHIRNNAENRNFGFEIDGDEVIPLYDPPHLLKGIRNALFQYNVKYTWRTGANKIATWKHLKRLYELEDLDDDYKLCTKLTDAHIYNLKKMKVKYAAQVFSARVAAAMKSLARHGQPGSMPAEALDTAEFMLFMDKAFDSINGSRVGGEPGKPLRAAVTDTSVHQQFWVEAIKVFQSMEFLDGKMKAHITPSIKNWIHTLKGFKYLCTKLKEKGFKFVCPRNFNQDPLENFFGCVRSHGVRNVNPSCKSFVGSLKSLIISNFTMPHSPSANCEADDLGGLDSLKEFIRGSSVENEGVIPSTYPEYSAPANIPSTSLLKQGKLTYIAGYMARKLLRSIGACQQCRSDLVGVPHELSQEGRSFIEHRSYGPNALLYPTTNFDKLFRCSVNIVTYVLPKICYNKSVGLILRQNVLNNINVSNMFNCKEHDVLRLFVKFLCTFHIFTWCKNINRILKGKDVRTRNYTDPIKIRAKHKYESHQKAVKKINIVKNL